MEVFNEILIRLIAFTNEIFIAELLFFFRFKRRKKFPLRFALCTVLYVFPFTVYPGETFFLKGMAIGWFDSYFTFAFILSSLVCFICFEVNWRELLFCAVAALALQHISGNFASVTLILSGLPGRPSLPALLLEILYDAAVYTLGYFIFARRIVAGQISFGMPGLVISTLIMLVVLFSSQIATSFLPRDQVAGWCVLNVYGNICCLMGVLLQFGIFERDRLITDNSSLEHLVEWQGKKQKLSSESIELINIKYHDLKKQIALIRASDSDETREKYLADVEHAIGVYGNIMHTGNESLDVILTEKTMYCQVHGINMSVNADGECVRFMSAADVYALFGNALDNAIEAVMALSDESKYIDVNIIRRGGLACIDIVNPCGGNVVFKDGLPITTKSDARFHGYGFRSMKYVVDKYGGGMNCSVEDGTFKLDIVFQIK